MTLFPLKPTPQKTFEKLKAGNERFASGQNHIPRFDDEYRKMLAVGERSDHVIATVVGCSDSRVSPEFVFNSDPGDLFVIRTAGFACLSDESLASVNFGVVQLKSPLLVVLGHNDCKAVKGAIQKMGADTPEISLVLKITLLRLAHSLEADMEKMDFEPENLDDKTLDEIIKQNVFLTADRIIKSCPQIRKHQADGTLIVAPAFYHLESGTVEWL